MSYLWTSEFVSPGHPDKVADQIADSILDTVLEKDPTAKAAIEVVVTRINCDSPLGPQDLVILTGEVNSSEIFRDCHYEKSVWDVLDKIGYSKYPNEDSGFCKNLIVQNNIRRQSVEIASAVDAEESIGAGDQGMMFGFANDESPNFMPLAHFISRELVKEYSEAVGLEESCFFPDAKSQVTINYGDETCLDTVLMSACHKKDVSLAEAQQELIYIIEAVLKKNDLNHLMKEDTKFILNPAGAWHLGGPASDTGLSGRKIVVDQYGPYCPIGGGSFSGKDPTKVDRSAAYAARWLAKNIVAAGISSSAQVQLSYGIGISEPISMRVKLDSLAKAGMAQRLTDFIQENISLTPKAIIDRFQLRDVLAVCYPETAALGHFGNDSFPWEKIENIFGNLVP